MTAVWTLPMQAALGGRAYRIHSDYRDVLEILRWLDGGAAPELDRAERWYVAMRLFYPEFPAMPQQDWPAATDFLADFLAAGRPAPTGPAPRLMDWQQDAPLIAAGIRQAAGQDVRALPYLHWWSFLSAFDAIGDGTFATVVGLRDKLRRGKKLEPGTGILPRPPRRRRPAPRAGPGGRGRKTAAFGKAGRVNTKKGGTFGAEPFV